MGITLKKQGHTIAWVPLFFCCTAPTSLLYTTGYIRGEGEVFSGPFDLDQKSFNHCIVKIHHFHNAGNVNAVPLGIKHGLFQVLMTINFLVRTFHPILFFLRLLFFASFGFRLLTFFCFRSRCSLVAVAKNTIPVIPKLWCCSCAHDWSTHNCFISSVMLLCD